MKAFRKALPQRPAAPLPPAPTIGTTSLLLRQSRPRPTTTNQAAKYCQQCDARLCSDCDRTVHASRVASAHVRVDVHAHEKTTAPVPQVDKATTAKWTAEAYSRLEEIKSLEADLATCGRAAKEALDKHFDELAAAVSSRKQELAAELSSWLRNRHAATAELKRNATQVAEGRQAGPVEQLDRGQGLAFTSASASGGAGNSLSSAIRASGKLVPGPLGAGGVMRPPARDYASIKGPKYTLGYGKGRALGEFTTPCDIAVHPVTGEIYVAELGCARVQVWNSDGQALRQFGTTEEDGKSLIMPRDIMFDRDGNVVVSDGRNRLSVWTTDGKFLRNVVGTPALSKGVSTIQGLVLQPGTGNYVIVDSRNDRVQIWQPDGAFVSAFSLEDFYTNDLAVDPTTGNYITASSRAVGVWSPKGQLITSFAGALPEDTEKLQPTSVAVDAAGNILVLDEANHRVQVWSPDFELLCAFGSPDQLRDPNFVVVAPNGDVIVSVNRGSCCMVF